MEQNKKRRGNILMYFFLSSVCPLYLLWLLVSARHCCSSAASINTWCYYPAAERCQKGHVADVPGDGPRGPVS